MTAPNAAAAVPNSRRGVLVLATLAMSLAAAIWPRLPAVVPASAPETEVSAARAMAQLERIATAPRPSGSPQHAHAREQIVSELVALGLPVEQSRGVFRHPLVNLVVPIVGSASTGTVLLMAHYDSVSRGPGAGDDGIGVVSWLEALRALRASGWQPRNDVLLLLTDGEENGLLGAHLFARTDARVAKVKTIVNLEAIGNGGPAILFELGPHNGSRVGLYADTVARPAGSSFAEAVYHALPNDTDLSVFLKRGTQGFNLALACGSCAYHAPHDTPDNLDPRSVQHMAATAAALARRLGDADLGTLRAADVTFFDLLGACLIAWPRAWDAWLAVASLLLAVGMLWRARTGGRALLCELGRHAAGVGLLTGLVVGACWLGDQVLAWFVARPAWVPGNTTSAALMFAGTAALVAAASLPRGDLPPERLAGRVAMAALLWSLAGIAASLWLPGSAFAWTWPVLAVGLPAQLPPRWRESLPVLLLPFAACAVLGLPVLHLLTQLMAREPLVALGLVTVAVASASRLLSAPLQSIARANGCRRCLWLAGSVALLLALVGARWLGWRGGALWP